MKVLLQCIYTFDNGMDQVIIDFKKLPETALTNEKNFVAYAKTPLTNPEEDALIKISACIYGEEEPPKWFMECWGKFYFKQPKNQDA